MDELGQGGMSRGTTTSSARTRWRAERNSTRSHARTGTRDSMRSRASSTVIMAPLYPLPSAAAQAEGFRAAPLLGKVQDGLIAREKPGPTQQEEREEAGRDQEIDWSNGQRVARRHAG